MIGLSPKPLAIAARPHSPPTAIPSFDLAPNPVSASLGDEPSTSEEWPGLSCRTHEWRLLHASEPCIGSDVEGRLKAQWIRFELPPDNRLHTK
jgi:hypothetical protein